MGLGVAQKTAFIVDQDRDFALSIAAALRSDGLKVGISEGDRDPLDEIRAERPDIVLMRAELSGKETGYTLCSRVKRNKRLQATTVFLYTQDTSTDTLATHQTQETRADDYIVMPQQPPYPLEQVRDRVRQVLFAAPNADRPPPLPRGNTDIGAGKDLPTEPKPTAPEDQSFLDRVIGSIGGVDEEAPQPARAPGARTAAADRKADLLRDKLRQRETELARLAEMYRAKEREYHQFNERLVEKDVEAQALRLTIDDLERQVEANVQELERRTQEFNASFEQLLEDKVILEKDLIEAVAGKEKELSDLRGEHYALDDRTRAEISSLTGKLDALQKKSDQQGDDIASLDANLADRERSIKELEVQLEGVVAQKVSLEKDRSSLEDQVGDLEARIVVLAQTIIELRADLADTREQSNEQAIAFDAALVGREQVIEGLKADLDSERASYAQAESELKEELADRGRALSDTQEHLSRATARGDALSSKLSETERATSEEISRLSGSLSHKTDELESARAEWAAAEDGFHADIAAQNERFAALSEAKGALEERAAAEAFALRGAIAERESTLAELRQELESTRDSGEARAAELEDEIKRLEGERNGLSDRLADKVAELDAARADADREIEALSAQIAEAEQRLRDGAQREREAASTRTDLENRLSMTEGELRALDERTQSEIASLSQTLSDTKEKAEDVESELRSQIIAISADLAERGDQIDQLTRALEDETRDRQLAEQKIEELKVREEHTRAELERTAQNLKTTERELGQTRETLALREGRLTELAESLQKEIKVRGDREIDLAALRADYDARASEVGRLSGRVASLEESLKDARQAKSEVDASLDETRRELFTRQAELLAARTESSERAARLEDLTRVIKDREREINEARGQVTELGAERERLTRERDGLVRDRERLEREVEGAEQQNAAAAQEIDDLKEEIDRLTEDRSARDVRIEALRENLRSTEEQKAETERARLTVSAELARTEEARAGVIGELDRARAEWAEGRALLLKERDGLRARMAEMGEELDHTRGARDEAIHQRQLFEEQTRARLEAERQEKEGLRGKIEGLEARSVARDEEVRQEILVREEHTRTLDREIVRMRDELAETRRREEQGDREIASLTDRLDDTRAELEAARAEGEQDRTDAQSELDELRQAMAEAEKAAKDRAGQLGHELEAERKKREDLDRALTALRAEREKDELRRDSEASHLKARLEDTAQKFNQTMLEKRQFEERARSEIEVRDSRAGELEKQLERRHAETQGLLKDQKEQVAKLESRIADLNRTLEGERDERESLESRYLKELEDTHDTYMKRMAEKEAEMRKEVEDLRNGALDAKRQLKASQLAAQRLTERITKLETERPLKSGAEEDFEAFMRQYTTRKSSPPPPGSKASLPPGSPPPPAAPVHPVTASTRPMVANLPRPPPPPPPPPRAPGEQKAEAERRLPPPPVAHRPRPSGTGTGPMAQAMRAPAGTPPPPPAFGDEPATQAGQTPPPAGPKKAEEDVSAALEDLFGGPDETTDGKKALADDLNLDRS